MAPSTVESGSFKTFVVYAAWRRDTSEPLNILVQAEASVDMKRNIHAPFNLPLLAYRIPARLDTSSN
jgi:hypothetical protein